MSRYLVFAAKGIYEPDLYPCPDWYVDLVACDRLHCKPWELKEQSIWYRDRAIIAQSAEHSARKQLKQLGM